MVVVVVVVVDFLFACFGLFFHSFFLLLLFSLPCYLILVSGDNGNVMSV